MPAGKFPLRIYLDLWEIFSVDETVEKFDIADLKNSASSFRQEMLLPDTLAARHRHSARRILCKAEALFWRDRAGTLRKELIRRSCRGLQRCIGDPVTQKAGETRTAAPASD